MFYYAGVLWDWIPVPSIVWLNFCDTFASYLNLLNKVFLLGRNGIAIHLLHILESFSPCEHPPHMPLCLNPSLRFLFSNFYWGNK